MEALVAGTGMNDFLERLLGEAGKAMGSSCLSLYDYDETAGVFDLLFFSGYAPDARSDLRQRMAALNLQRARSHTAPYWANDSRVHLLIPLYFLDTLEAVLVLEVRDRPLELDASVRNVCHLLSRFVGMFMSSSRLPVNQRRDAATVSDLARAREVQMSYLPAEHPSTDRYEIYGYNQSSALVGGDYFGYFQQRRNSIQCVVADACGHGMASALIMSHFRGLLLAELERPEDLGTLFIRLNKRMHSGGEMVQYLTGVFLEYREDRGELAYLNAGHFDPLLIHEDGTSLRLEGGGPPLGMFRDSTYALCQGKVVPGDLLLLFTDGLVELKNERDDFFSVRGILDCVLARRNQPLRTIAGSLLSDAAEFCRNCPPQDDLTLFLMRIR